MLRTPIFVDTLENPRLKITAFIRLLSSSLSAIVNRTKYSGMDRVKLVEDSLQKS